MLRIQTFGGLRIAFSDALLPLPASHASRSLLVHLLLHADQPQPRAVLVGVFWPDLPESTARRRLSNALWEIRHSLAPAGEPALLSASPQDVAVNSACPYWFDVAAFHTALEQADAGQDSLAQEAALAEAGDKPDSRR